MHNIIYLLLLTKPMQFCVISASIFFTRNTHIAMLFEFYNMNFLLLSLVIFNIFNNAASLYCYWNTGCPYKYLSSKTPYNAVRGDMRDSVVKLTGK